MGDKLSKEFVEGYANACWDVLLALKVVDDYCKSYDPMTIDEYRKVAHSYIFDLWDGGRHHPYKNLEQIKNGVFNETMDDIVKSDRQDLIKAIEDWCEK